MPYDPSKAPLLIYGPQQGTGAYITTQAPDVYGEGGQFAEGEYTQRYQGSIWDPYTQSWILPGVADPYGQAGLLGGSWAIGEAAGARRLADAQAYLQATQGAQSAALRQQQLALGNTAQQQLAGQAGGSLQERQAMYAGARQAEQQIGEQAQRRAQEQMVAQGLLQGATGAQAEQAMAEAGQMQQLHGIEYGREQQQIQGDAAKRQAEQEAAIDWEKLALQAGVAIGGAAVASDRRLKLGVRMPAAIDEAELLRALRGGSDA